MVLTIIMQDGLSGLILATQNGSQEIVQTLLRSGADPDITETVKAILGIV